MFGLKTRSRNVAVPLVPPQIVENGRWNSELDKI